MSGRTKTFDTYAVDAPDLATARAAVEAALAVPLALHNSTYWGGDYCRIENGEFGEVAVRPNWNSFTSEPSEPSSPDVRFIARVNAPRDADAVKARLGRFGIRHIDRQVTGADTAATSATIAVAVAAADAAAKGLAAVTIEVDTAAAGMFARPFPGDDLLLLLNGPPGAPIIVGIWSGAGEQGLEAVVRAKLSPSWFDGLEIGQPARAMVSGEELPALTFITGDGPQLMDSLVSRT